MKSEIKKGPITETHDIETTVGQDYEQQVGAVGAALAQQAGETGQSVRDLEARLQHRWASFTV